MDYLPGIVVGLFARLVGAVPQYEVRPLIALNKLLAETLAVDSSALVDSLAMTDVAKWNSLTHIELIVGLEELYGIQFTQDDVVEMTSVGAIRGVLRRYGIVTD
jgi:acyl carrier protein